MSQHNRLSLIVGGSTGMGKATARMLLAEGRTVLIASRNPERLAAAQAELDPEDTGRVETFVVDLSDDASVDAFVARIDAEPRHIDQLVNAAGVFAPTPFLEHTRADYDRYMDINRGTFFVTQAVARNMRGHRGGSIVNIGSMWARQAVKATPSSAYSMGQGRATRAHPAPGDGARGPRDPRQRRVPSGRRDTDLRGVHRP